MQTITLNLRAVPKPRMVKSDSWKIPSGKAKKCIYNYLEFKDEIIKQSTEKGFELANSFAIRFYMSMPDSWSNKKKLLMNGKPHQQKPDLDNLIKAVGDCLKDGSDQSIFSIMAMKVWADTDTIEIENRIDSNTHK